jgi:hypothetical protein
MISPLFLKKKSVRYFLLAAFILIVAGISIGLHLYTKKHKDLSKVKAEYIMNAPDLLAAFESDEAAASAKFINKVIEVTGIVSDLEFNPVSSTLTITLTGDNGISGVICTINGITEEKYLSVEVNQKLTVRGECSGMLMDVLMNNCILVK